MAPTSILHDPYYLDVLSWSDVEALMMRSQQAVPRFFVSKRGLINLSSMPDSAFRREFRFVKDDFSTLCQALGIPKMVSSAQGVNIPGWEALCTLLRRLAYPNRLCDLELFFGRHSSVISIITNILLEHIDRSFGHLLDDVRQLKWLSATDLDELSESDLYSKLERLVGEHHYVIYGDPAYPLRHLIMKPYGGFHLTREQQNFNSAMSTVRQAVEWGFGKVV
ncbi:hypothetical protein HPB48_016383 [Haemaphysalis longicornis]|uniref:DDE Tnp4 domain-containing protein n=1 Tax=Haemaphysalis longicornis TaxID=44386 RepID=A0A9J6FLY8_HAELO|nr:hypothetical protein HPB48_016383 [Haemaphysalis longicornis]